MVSASICASLAGLSALRSDTAASHTRRSFISSSFARISRDRSVGLMENGSWAPAAARLMRARLEEMKDLRVCGTVVSLRSALGPANEAQMEALSAELCAK